MKTPCYMCEKRTIACHGTCEEYKKFNEFMKEQRKRKAISSAVRRPLVKPVKGKKNEWRQLR